jgi:short-subunit dehydrogenase
MRLRHRIIAKKVAGALGSIDGVIVAFGYLGDQERAQAEFAEAARIIEVNFTATVALLEPLAEVLATQRRGWLLGLSSVAGVRGRKSNYVYGAAKGAFTLYLEGLAHRLASSGVQVKIAKLGFVASKMTRGMTMPGWAVATPAEVARGLVWLLKSPFQSAYIPWRWWPIMTIIRLLPARIFNRTKL